MDFLNYIYEHWAKRLICGAEPITIVSSPYSRSKPSHSILATGRHLDPHSNILRLEDQVIDEVEHPTVNCRCPFSRVPW